MYIPIQFDISFIDSVTCLGTSLYPEPEYTLDKTARVITINKVNSVYINSLSFITLVFGLVENPSETNPTDTFQYKIYDPLGAPVE